MSKFLLPNNKPIDIDQVIVAMQDNNPKDHFFLNRQTGDVKLISEAAKSMSKQTLKHILNNDNFFPIPSVSLNDQFEWAKDFTVSLVEHEDNDMYEMLIAALNSKDALRHFEDVLGQDKGWQAGWHQWKDDCCFEEMLSWFDRLDIVIKEEMEYDDDCPVCQAMKRGDYSLDGLKAAFQKAGDQGAMVGGEWFIESEEGQSDKG